MLSLHPFVLQACARDGEGSLQAAATAIEAGVLLREHAAGDCCGGGGGDGGGRGGGDDGGDVNAAATRAEAETLLRAALATQQVRRAAIRARGFTLEVAIRDRTAQGDEHTERGLATLSDLLLERGEWAEVRRVFLLAVRDDGR